LAKSLHQGTINVGLLGKVAMDNPDQNAGNITGDAYCQPSSGRYRNFIKQMIELKQNNISQSRHQ